MVVFISHCMIIVALWRLCGSNYSCWDIHRVCAVQDTYLPRLEMLCIITRNFSSELICYEKGRLNEWPLISLSGISGDFRLAIFTSLIGVSGAGLMEIFSGGILMDLLKEEFYISDYPKNKQYLKNICQGTLHRLVRESLLCTAFLHLLRTSSNSYASLDLLSMHRLNISSLITSMLDTQWTMRKLPVVIDDELFIFNVSIVCLALANFTWDAKWFSWMLFHAPVL